MAFSILNDLFDRTSICSLIFCKHFDFVLKCPIIAPDIAVIANLGITEMILIGLTVGFSVDYAVSKAKKELA